MEKLMKKKSPVIDYIAIIIGTGLMGLAIQCIFDPISLVMGGFTGMAIIVKYVTEGLVEGGIPLWLTNLVLNIPVFLVALKVKGSKFIGRTFFATIMLSVWLYIIPAVDLSMGDYTLATIFGGVISGAGMGMVFLAKATTGGTDMVAAIIQVKLKHYSIAQIMQFIDGAVVVTGLYVFGLKPTMYAIVTIFIVAKVSDMLMEGLKFSKAAYIITDKYDAVAEVLLTKLDRGVTGLEAKGMYSGNEKFMLFCVVSKKQIVELKDLVVQIDPNAFVIVSDVREVMGEGFIEYTSK